jgi:hypothetical protein
MLTPLVFGCKERIRLTGKQYVQRFIQHCSDVDPLEAESNALATGGPDIETFIRTIKGFKKDLSWCSPFRKAEQNRLPSVVYEVRHKSLPITSKNRVGAEMLTSNQYAQDTLAKREIFVSPPYRVFDRFIELGNRCAEKGVGKIRLT